MIRLRVLLPIILPLVSCLVAGCRPPPLFSYPRFWDFTRTKPQDIALQGTYKILKLRLPANVARRIQNKNFAITLAANHTALFQDVPDFEDLDDTAKCTLSGSATWKLNDQGGGGFGWAIDFDNYRPATKSAGGGHEDGTWDILILGQRPPYRLYTIVGDPDSDEGIEYEHVGR